MFRAHSLPCQLYGIPKQDNIMILNLKNLKISEKIYIIISTGLVSLIVVSVFSFYLIRTQNAATLMVMCERRYAIELHHAEKSFDQYVRTGEIKYKKGFEESIDIVNSYADVYGKIDIYLKTRPKKEIIEETFSIYQELTNRVNAAILIDRTELLLFFDVQLVTDLIKQPKKAFPLGLDIKLSVENFMDLPEEKKPETYVEISEKIEKMHEYGEQFSKIVNDLLMFVQKLSLILLILISLVTIMFCLTFTLHVTRSITRPIPILMAGINRIREGDLTGEVNIHSEDEMGAIAKCFNNMAASLNDNQKTIKKAYENLQSSEKRIRALFNTATSAGIGIVVVQNTDDQDGIIQFINPGIAQIMGYEESEIIGRNFLQFFHPHSHEEIIKYYSIQEQQKETPQQSVFKAIKKDHNIIYLEISAKNMEFNGKPAVVAYISDISERKIAEEELADLNKKLIDSAHKSGMADIATGVLHNVGNILNSVSVSTQIMNGMINDSKISDFKRANDMLRDNLDNLEQFIVGNPKGKMLMNYYLKIEDGIEKEMADFRHHFTRLNEKVKAITEVIAALQNYAGTASLLDTVSINDIIEDALTMHARTNAFQNTRVIKKMLEIPDLTVQKTKLVHILINLFQNAKDAMLETPIEKKVLTILTEHDVNNAFIKIYDTGHGVAEQDLQKIFAHGFPTKTKSYGFGLHNCANYMTEMGGSMWVESDGKGKGATFILKFPLPKDSRNK